MMYSNNAYIPEPETEQVIWRYLDFAKFAEMLRTKSLRMTQLSKFPDKFEGLLNAITKQAIKERFERVNKLGLPIVTLDMSDEDFEKIKDQAFIIGCDSTIVWYERAREIVYASCWHMNQYESRAMWEIYLNNDFGIAIKSRYSRLKSSLVDCKRRYAIGAVVYFEKDEIIEGYFNMFESSQLNLALKKLVHYKFEQELRVVSMADEYLTIGADGTSAEAVNESIAAGFEPISGGGFNFHVMLDDLIENIIVSPGAPDWFFELVKYTAKSHRLDDRVIRSEADT